MFDDGLTRLGQLAVTAGLTGEVDDLVVGALVTAEVVGTDGIDLVAEVRA